MKINPSGQRFLFNNVLKAGKTASGGELTQNSIFKNKDILTISKRDEKK